MKDNKDQVIRADDLNQAKTTWFDYAATLNSHRAQNIPVNPDWVRVGKSLTDAIHDKFTKFIQSRRPCATRAFSALTR